MGNLNYNYDTLGQCSACFTGEDSSTVFISGSGSICDPASFHVKVSSEPDNGITIENDGLYVANTLDTGSIITSGTFNVFTASIQTQINDVFISESNYTLTSSFSSLSSSVNVQISNSFLSQSNYTLTSSFNAYSSSISVISASLLTQINNVFLSESKYTLTSSFNDYTASMSASQAFVRNQYTSLQSASFSITGSGLIGNDLIVSKSIWNPFISQSTSIINYLVVDTSSGKFYYNTASVGGGGSINTSSFVWNQTAAAQSANYWIGGKAQIGGASWSNTSYLNVNAVDNSNWTATFSNTGGTGRGISISGGGTNPLLEIQNGILRVTSIANTADRGVLEVGHTSNVAWVCVMSSSNAAQGKVLWLRSGVSTAGVPVFQISTSITNTAHYVTTHGDGVYNRDIISSGSIYNPYISQSSNITQFVSFDTSSGKYMSSNILGIPYTPSSTADSFGNTGSIAYDSSYVYIKTAAGWKRSALSTF